MKHWEGEVLLPYRHKGLMNQVALKEAALTKSQFISLSFLWGTYCRKKEPSLCTKPSKTPFMCVKDDIFILQSIITNLKFFTA